RSGGRTADRVGHPGLEGCAVSITGHLARANAAGPRDSMADRSVGRSGLRAAIALLICHLVRSEGLEPPRFYSLPPQGSASTNSATSAKVSTGQQDRAGSTAPM